MTELEKLQFPVGKHVYKNQLTPAERKDAIEVLTHFPTWLEIVLQNMDATQLEIPYRPAGWNTRQVVHHCADSHMNCLIRIKNALTENNPAVKPYAEDKWATCADYNLPIQISTTLIHAVHKKLVAVLISLQAADFARTTFHPEHNAVFTIDGILHLYQWHCKHHLGHIKIVHPM